MIFDVPDDKRIVSTQTFPIPETAQISTNRVLLTKYTNATKVWLNRCGSPTFARTGETASPDSE